MQQLSIKKRLGIIRLYLSGLGYAEIASKMGVAKGSITNVIDDLRAGVFPEASDIREQLDALRELACDLHKLKLSPAQAIVGLAVIARLHELHVEPEKISGWVIMCQQLAPDEVEAKTFVNAALYLDELRKRTGLTVEALEIKVHSLEENLGRLKQVDGDLNECKKQLGGLEKQKKALVSEISQLERRCDPLRKDVSQKEQREAELSRRVIELEQRVQLADTQLAPARKELVNLARIGLSVGDISALGQRVAGVAQRHNIKPKELRGRFLKELEALDAELGIESLVASRQREIKELETSIIDAQRQRKALEQTLKQLRQQHTTLGEAISQQQIHVLKGMQAAVTIADDAVNKLKKDLKDSMAEVIEEVTELRNQSIEVGKELGHSEEIIKSNKWLQTLASLATGNESASASDVRVAALVTLRGLKGWVLQHPDQLPQAYWISMQLDRVIEEVERWQV